MNLKINTSLAGKYNKYPCFHSKIARPLTISAITIRPSAFVKLPARDRVIDFGKYKGRMLGSLQSNYLKWVSKNLRARDFEEWANLADEVLIDPIYRDRIEWEFAEKILSGNTQNASSPVGDAVSELLEISDRFGWDNQDKVAWGKIDFFLLGTSKGGRIPRAVAETGVLEIGSLEEERGDDFEEDGGRRKERRERIRQRGALKKSNSRRTSSVAGGTTTVSRIGEGQKQERGTLSAPSPFPGREALLKKVLNCKTMI